MRQPLVLLVEDYGVPQARWELAIAPGGDDDEGGPSSSSPAASADDGAAAAAAAAPGTMTVRDAKARFTREVFGEDAPDAWAFFRLPLGQPLDDDAPLASSSSAAAASSSTQPHHSRILRVRAAPRLQGGGGDGGSTCAESRSCFLEMYAGKKPDKVDPHEEALARWTRCALTGDALQLPVVADALGSLFNKEAAVAALLASRGDGGGEGVKPLPEALRGHVTGLRSLTDAKLALAADVARSAAAAAGTAADGGDAAAAPSAANANDDDASVRFACPVTGTPMNGRFRFYLHKPSGVVLSERALREAPRAIVEEALGLQEAAAGGAGGAGGEPSPSLPAFAALQQQAAVGEGDFLPLNPPGPELTRLRTAVMARLEAERERKAAKKAGKKKEQGGGGAGGEGAGKKRGDKRPAAEGDEAAKKSKTLRVPEGATPAVYASIFAKPGEEGAAKETFCARAVSGRHA